MKVISLILFVLCVSSIAVARGLTPLIIGGKDAKDGQFPYQVSLRTRIISNQHFCGASIISTRYLLTAAHCAEGITSKPFFVVAVIGSVNRNSGVTIKLNKITRHEKWNRNLLLNDIALIQTASEIIFSETIQPIALPTKDLPNEGNTAVLLSGWGKNSLSYPNQVPNILQFTEPLAISLDNCIERFRKVDEQIINFVRKENVCTINGKLVGACNGDSGGPLAYDSGSNTKTLVGVVSWAVLGCAKGYPDVFTRVYSYVDWIQNHMEL